MFRLDMSFFSRVRVLFLLVLLVISGCESFDNVESSASAYFLSEKDLIDVKTKALKGDAASSLRMAQFYTLSNLNEDEAFFWYRLASEQGSVIAMTNLAYLYHERYENDEKAIGWYCEAANLGHKEAHIEIARILESKGAYGESLNHYLLAYLSGEESASEYLVKYYFEDKYHMKSPVKAYAWSRVWMDTFPKNSYAYTVSRKLSGDINEELDSDEREASLKLAEEYRSLKVEGAKASACVKK